MDHEGRNIEPTQISRFERIHMIVVCDILADVLGIHTRMSGFLLCMLSGRVVLALSLNSRFVNLFFAARGKNHVYV